MSSPHFTLAELAARFHLQLRGDGGHAIFGVGTLESATAGQLTFLANPHYRTQLAGTRAGAVVLRAADAEDLPRRLPDRGRSLRRVRQDRRPLRAHRRARARRASECGRRGQRHCRRGRFIGPFCFVGDGAVVDAGAVLGPHCSVGERCHVGAQAHLVARVTLVRDVTLGKRVLVHPGAVIGADGFGIAFDQAL